jgi:hypothetical protein
MRATIERRIVTQLKTWCEATGIPAVIDQGLHVRNIQGEPLKIDLVGPGEPTGLRDQGHVAIDGANFTSRDLQKGLDAFGRLQVLLGYEPRNPVNRGPIPTRKAYYGNNFELVAMRHTDLRRVPNPPPGKLESYRVVVDKAVWKFFRTNQVRCQDNLLTVDDLRTYAQVWTTEYIGMYEVSTASRQDNERFLFHFLSQRFSEFRVLLDKKNRNVLPMLDEAFIATHGRPYEYTTKADWFTADGYEEPHHEVASEWETEDDEQALSADETVKAAEADVTIPLDQQLEALGHGKMVDALRGVVENDRIHIDARREASKRLQAHAMRCIECSKVEFPKAHGDDAVAADAPIVDENGVQYDNTRDAAKKLGVYASNIRAVLSGRNKTSGGHTFKYASTAGTEA